jgi:hypothetical protein
VSSRGLSVAAAVASALLGGFLLSGCASGRALPEPPSASEIRAATQRAVDRQWVASGLQGRVARPELPVGRLMADEQSGFDLDACVAAAGIGTWFYDSVEGLLLGDGSRGDDAQQLAFYSCFARYPQLVVFSGAQRAFIYDYYLRIRIPCLGLHGYPVADIPSRDDFVVGAADVAGAWLWSPDMGMRSYPAGEAEWVRLYVQCPPTVPGVDGWSHE